MARLTYTSGGIDEGTDKAFAAALEKVRGDAGETLPHVIGGETVSGGKRFERVNPAHTGEVASSADEASEGIVADAVNAARKAARAWGRRPYEERCEILGRAARAIETRIPEIAAVISLETGKTRTESLAEVQEGVDLFDTYCEEMRRNEGFRQSLKSNAPNETNVDVLRPHGVFGVISPFNFPFALAINMTAAALVAGNTVVLKPSEDAPWTGQLVADLLAEAEVPAGAFNMVHGGRPTGEALVAANVDGIAFTGSAKVGQEIARRMLAGKHARPALTEMGGKNPALVTAAADLEKATEGIAKAAYGLSGQKCTACSRVIVDEAVADELIERLRDYTAELKLGPPEDAAAFLGPVVNERAYERYAAAASKAKADGTLVIGGGIPDLDGYYVEPTVVADLPVGHELTRDELFLPFVTVTRVSGLAAALEEANATDYGLTAGIFTDDDAEAEQFFEEIEAGLVYRNRGAGATTGAWPGTQALSGWKSSGTTGKGALGPHYLPQFMREQGRTVIS